MSKKDAPKRRKARNPRRMFGVRGQLQGKLGNEGLEALLAQLEKAVR